MSQSLLERAQGAMKAGLKRGAQGVRASATRSRESTVEYRDGKLDRVRESTQLSLNVTLFVDGRYSSSSTNDLRPPAVEKFLDEVIAQTRLLVSEGWNVIRTGIASLLSRQGARVSVVHCIPPIALPSQTGMSLLCHPSFFSRPVFCTE